MKAYQFQTTQKASGYRVTVKLTAHIDVFTYQQAARVIDNCLSENETPILILSAYTFKVDE